MKKKITFAILFDLKEKRPFAIWVTDEKNFFERNYQEGYEEVEEKFDIGFDGLNLKKVDWHGFWDYWTNQGGMNYNIQGPYYITDDDPVPQVANELFNDLDKMVNMVRKNKLDEQYK